MSLSRGASPPPHWLPLPLLLLLAVAVAAASSTALASSDEGAPPSAAPAPLQDQPEAASDEDSALDDFFRQSRAPRDNFLRFGKAGRDNFLRFGRAPRDNFLRFGKAGRDNFLRFGRAPRDNFLRFGKAARDNFLRFGRAPRDNFLRFGRAPRDNFLRFGKAARDNFLRFGRAPRDNFLRFGKAGRDNFVRFGRGDDGQLSRDLRDRASSNFVRFGRSGEDSDLTLDEESLAARLENEDPQSGDLPSADQLQQFMRSARDRNFLRFGRARQDNFFRLGRDAAPEEDASVEQTEPEGAEPAPESATVSSAPGGAGEEEEAAGAAANNGETDDDHMQRVGRAARPRNLFGRWKMSDLNFIRLGRSAPAPTDSDTEIAELMAPPVKRSAYAEQARTSRSQSGRGKQQNYANLFRLGGKRSDDLVRTERAAPATDAAVAGQDVPSPAPRTKRALRSSDGPGGSGSSGADCGVRRRALGASLFPDLPLAPLSYYSPLAVGLPNYLFALPSDDGAAVETKRGGGDKNFIRLG